MINEIMDTSSESEDMCNPNEGNKEEDIDAIINKYIRENALLETPNKNEPTTSNYNQINYNLVTSSDEDDEINLPIKEKAKSNKNLNKEEKLAMRREKQKERTQKQTQKQLEKAVKQAQNLANKNLKPEECTKFITVHIDNDLMKEFGNEIVESLSEASYESCSQMFPNSITWSRRVQSHIIDNLGKVNVTEEIHETDDILIFLDSNTIITHISDKTLITFVESITSILASKKIYLAIFGLKHYLSYLKRIKNHEKRAEISETVQKLQVSQKFQDLPILSKSEIENSLTELQLFHSCSYEMVENKTDFGLMVARFTKSIAQLPYKLQKQQTHQKAEWYISGDNRDSVKVDKNGNGLKRLWKQSLMTFPMAGLEISEAISTNFPTVTSLMKAYENCQSEVEGKQLLQNIPIRRGAGLLTESRRIGPELSKKAYNFFTSTSGDDFIS